MPTRPSQNDPERVSAWAAHRRTVGDNIRRLRISCGLTQEALALQSGVTRNVLLAVEHGRRGLLYERLFDIADALGVPASRLLDSHNESGEGLRTADSGDSAQPL
ncbi:MULTISPECIES: helix-turn-helix domain-containing protein [Mycolicibacterium]|uniref:Transcriptional regulator, XRE family n=1 Tax=Mycolicibacterium vanbaalenii (strain DSM 7251 / JCM 13017 / BCRC 16820 / KCTC 9966 / NRRL B-24157 / PYR-1) TaxID=350058 RepID=A1TA66_MYCVP|nr:MULTISPECIES: helix-turn-helix transcriptional regulator [Mycolicibacterium]ABM14066.1 transcriptional regulator, XRE family [Mycolicibacterium vanbaalenii PYR-1]MCV7128526.1 helix-turn-helix transcriptional regulator [Mycolicibacterium vanbaalenii PYR-1]MCV7367393.1 helix-turn-helix transcriptional regulator [Mycolicibacterium duvalii]PEG35462.1 XRE family transcriptional regulator [Mycolicibacterium duvalii]